MEPKKKRFGIKMSSIVIALIIGVLCSFIVYTQTPTPHNIQGRVFTNSSNGVQNGIPVLINDTNNGNVVKTAVNAPPPPPLRGSYSATISGTDGDLIIVTAWNRTHFGNASATLLSTTTTINVILNMSRGSEANLSILFPNNNTIKNKSILFNITANVSMLGSDGINCNATLNFTVKSILNVTSMSNATKELGNIPILTHRMINWSVMGINEGRINYSISVICDSDVRYLESLHRNFRTNITIVNSAPQIKQVRVPDPIDLLAASNLTLFCNATIEDANTVSDIALSNATFFQKIANYLDPDDRNSHYTNASCFNISSNAFEMNVSCSFPLSYFANNGTWLCNLTARDYSNVSSFNISNNTVNELLAIAIEPGVVDYGRLAPYEISADDVNVTISNIGNIPFNISVFGYARTENDGLFMNCTRGNISINNTKYSVVPSSAYVNMINLSAQPKRVGNITFPQRTNDITRANDTNLTFWKLEMPALVSGTCNGSLVFKTILT